MKFPRHFQGISRAFPGHFRDISTNFLRIFWEFPQNSREFPENCGFRGFRIPCSMNSLFGEFFSIFGQILGQILSRFWARFWARFLARFWARFFWGRRIQCTVILGQRKYSVQLYRDRGHTVLQYYFLFTIYFPKNPKIYFTYSTLLT